MCPNREQLQGVLLGLLSDAESEQVEQHLFECQRCVDTMAELGAGDTLIEAIAAHPSMALELAGYKHQVAAILGRWKGNVDFALTPPVSSAEEPTSDASPHGTVDDVQEALRLLAPAQAPDELGRLGQYRILRVLGSGGMGIVFEAEDSQLKRRVALKAMKPAVAASASSRKRFLREAQAAASVEHDHIVPIYQVGEDRGVPFIAMQFLRGETLAERLASGTRECAGKSSIEAGDQPAKDTAGSADTSGRLTPPACLPLAEVIRIGREIATGLDVAHRAGLIHRDIKPSNIWLEAGTGRVKILDFGLARAASSDEHLTHTGALVGTPSYMAPEQGRSGDIDARADLFSLGCVLYHMATGVRPFVGHNALATLMAVTTHDPRPPRELNPELPQELNDLIVSLLSKDPSGRPQTARQVAERLVTAGNPPQADGEPIGYRSPHAPREGNPQYHHAERDDDGGVSGSATPLAVPTGEGWAEGGGATTQLTTENQSPLKSSSNPPRRRGIFIALAAASAAAALLAGILITIKNDKDETIAQLESDKPIALDKVAPGTKVIIEEKADGKTQNAETRTSKTEDLSPKTSAGGWHGWPADAPARAIAPFDAAQARKHQQEWADYLKLPLEYTNSIGMKFVLIPPGEFLMGSTPEEIDETLKVVDPNESHWQECVKSEGPQHKVVLTRPFYLAVHEVTQKDYQAVMGANPSWFVKTVRDQKVAERLADLDSPNFPVETVSWSDAAEFCSKLSKQEQLRPYYFRAGETVTGLKGTGYRLPTEAEWEFACRAGTTTKFWIGDREEDLISAAWFGGNSGGRTHEVGELDPNPFALFDVHGNVWEWVEDSWQSNFYEQFAEKHATDPKSPFSASARRVARGGDWTDNKSDRRSAARRAHVPTSSSNFIGFRVALSPMRERSTSAPCAD